MIRIGVDFGGTKIEAAALDEAGRVIARSRKPNPGVYEQAVTLVADLIAEIGDTVGSLQPTVGVGMPGSISPKTGLVRNSNSVWLNDRPFHRDLEAALGRPIRTANDANCLALSEAVDGAAQGHSVVFAAILGTGCGGGLVVDGRLVEGKNGVGGEWGHTPLPWPMRDEHPGPVCWCGRVGCLETWIAGTGFEADYARVAGKSRLAADIMKLAQEGDAEAEAAYRRYVDRLGRALAAMCDLIDPDVIVFGGGMSNTGRLYADVLPVIARHIFSDTFTTPVVQATHGDSSGVRGAAWLWPLETS